MVAGGWGRPLRKLLGRLGYGDTILPEFVQEADRLRSEGELDEAALLCLRGLKRFPHYASAHVVLGDILREQGAPELAERHWREALRYHPEHPWAHLRLAQLHLARAEVAEALRELELSLLYSPHSPEASALLDTARAWDRAGEESLSSETRVQALLAAGQRGADMAVVVGEGGTVVAGRLYPRQAEAAGLGAMLMLQSRPLLTRLGAGPLRSAWVAGSEGSLQCYEVDGVALLAVVVGAGAKSAELARAVAALREAEGAGGGDG